MKTKVGFLFFSCLFLIAAGGWVANVVKMLSELSDPVTGLFLARIAGIFMVPLGSILGFF